MLAPGFNRWGQMLLHFGTHLPLCSQASVNYGPSPIHEGYFLLPSSAGRSQFSSSFCSKIWEGAP
jgi:hypothetical protein